MSLDSLLDQTCDIFSEASGVSDQGGRVPLPLVSVTRGVKCKVRPRVVTVNHDGISETRIAATIYLQGITYRLGTGHIIEVDGGTWRVAGVVDFNSMTRLQAVMCTRYGSD